VISDDTRNASFPFKIDRMRMRRCRWSLAAAMAPARSRKHQNHEKYAANRHNYGAAGGLRQWSHKKNTLRHRVYPISRVRRAVATSEARCNVQSLHLVSQ